MNYTNWAGINSFFLIFLIFTSPLDVCSYEISYKETEPGLKIYQILDYQDGNIVLFLTKPINKTCIEPRIDLRVIRPNGAVDKVNVDHPIPDFNFCLKPNDTSLHIKLFSKLNNIIILYENSTDVNFASFYAFIADVYTGNSISNSFLSKIPVIYGQLSHSANIYPHANEDRGFLFRTFSTATKMLLIYFSNPDQNGNLKLINRNEVELYSQTKFNIFPAIDGNFGLVTSNNTITPSQPSYNPTLKSLAFYLSIIKPLNDAYIDEPTPLYKTELRHVQSEFACGFSFTTIGYSCPLILKEQQPIGEPIDRFIRVDFKTAGSAINVKNLDLKSHDLGKVIKLINLYHGGYLVISLKNSNDNINNKTTVQATVFNDDGIYNSILLPEDLEAPNNIDLTVSFLQNHTLAVPKQEDEYNWKIILVEYPKFVNYNNGCDVPFVKSVFPSVNSHIPLSLSQISFTYEFPVIISANNISIYQHNNGKPILRQSVQASRYIPQSIDNKTLSLQVLDSTFNRPNSEYYVVIDDDVSQGMGKEPLTGIKKNIWKFNTAGNQYTIEDDATGLFALTAEGTKYYDDLPHHKQKAFLAQLKIDLSESIPVDINRLSNVEFFQYDRSQNLPKIILTMSVKSTKNKNEPNVSQIFRNLNTLIEQKGITIISRLNTTEHLDEKFGFTKIRNLFDDFKTCIDGIVIGITALILSYMFAKAVHPKGDNVVLLKNPLVVMNFILNILFMAFNGNNVKDLFKLSLMFFIIPIVFNIIMTITILLIEAAYNEPFHKWLMSNLVTSIICIILSLVDIEVLGTLFSQVAGIKYFNAPTDKMRNNLFLGGFIGLIVKDIPQFAIQVYYFLSFLINSYDIISFLSFVISSLVLMSNILSRAYYIIYYVYKKKRNSKISPEPKITVDCLISVPEPAIVRYRNTIQR